MFKANLCKFTEVLVGFFLEESVFSWRVCSVFCCVWSGWSSDWRLYHTLYTHVASLLSNGEQWKRTQYPGNEKQYTLNRILWIESLTGVYEGVFLHVGFLVESLSTVLAGIWPCVWVDQEVGGQCGWAFEYLPTFLTLKCSFLKSTIFHNLKTNVKFNKYHTRIVYSIYNTYCIYRCSFFHRNNCFKKKKVETPTKLHTKYEKQSWNWQR